MTNTSPNSKKISYAEILQELDGLLTGRWITDLANVSATLHQHVSDINWVGFYLTDLAAPTNLAGATDLANPNELKDANKNAEPILWLGPFQGLPACTMIPFSKGVCGAAATQRKSLRVDDVDLFPGHIVCDSRSKSEVVVPLIQNDKVIGVLDVDSATKARFTNEEQLFFEKVVSLLLSKTKEVL